MSFHQGKSKQISVPEYLLFFCFPSFFFPAGILQTLPRCPGPARTEGDPGTPTRQREARPGDRHQHRAPRGSASPPPRGAPAPRRRPSGELHLPSSDFHISCLCSDSHPCLGTRGRSGGAAELSSEQTVPFTLPPRSGLPLPETHRHQLQTPTRPPFLSPPRATQHPSPSGAVPGPAPGLDEPGSGLSSAPLVFIPSKSLPLIGNPHSKAGPDPATRDSCTTTGAGEGKTRSALSQRR